MGPDAIRDEWFPVARTASVTPATWYPFELLDDRFVLACGTGGDVIACRDTCPHRGAQLTLGTFDGAQLQCGYHGWCFDLSGRCVHQPAHPDRVPPAASGLRPLACRSELGFWWVCTGESPRELPRAPLHHRHPERTLWLEPAVVRSSGPRIIENFLDLAHFPFVHAGHLGQVPHTEVARYDVDADGEELRLRDCHVWQPQPGPAAAGGDVAYDYSVSHPYAATLTKVPADGSPGFSILLVATPVSETVCTVWRSTVVEPGADVDAQRAFNQLIFGQDLPTVESQRPPQLPLDPRAEAHQPADAGSLAYRKWLGERGIRYGTIPEEDP